MNLKDEIKILLAKSGISMTDLVNKLNAKYGRDDSVQNLNNKLARGTLKYSEFKELVDVLGYEVKLALKEDD